MKTGRRRDQPLYHTGDVGRSGSARQEPRDRSQFRRCGPLTDRCSPRQTGTEFIGERQKLTRAEGPPTEHPAPHRPPEFTQGEVLIERQGRHRPPLVENGSRFLEREWSGPGRKTMAAPLGDQPVHHGRHPLPSFRQFLQHLPQIVDSHVSRRAEPGLFGTRPWGPQWQPASCPGIPHCRAQVVHAQVRIH